MTTIIDRILVCGGRDYHDRQHLFFVLDTICAYYGARPSLLIAGAAAGADTLAVQWASSRDVLFAEVEAEWDLYGSLAGPVRNAKMLRIGRPTLVIAFPGGAGTKDMIAKSRAAAVPVLEITQHTPAASQVA